MFPINEKFTKVDLVFPANVLEFMPSAQQIGKYPKQLELESLVEHWFFNGAKGFKLVPKEGVDVQKALTHLKCVLGSFLPKHEHKIAAVAWLINEWFDEFKEVDEAPSKEKTPEGPAR